MALYETGTASSQEDLIGKLCAFAVTNGWTQDVYSTTDDWAGLTKGTVSVQFRWDNATGIALFHSLAFVNTSTPPGNHTDDSGSGLVDASTPYNSTVSSDRRVNVGNGPYTAYHFFTDASSTYIHVVLEYAAGLYRHFSFGNIVKKGTWTGGEYVAGHVWNSGATSDDPANTAHTVLWDGRSGISSAATGRETGTLHAEGLPGEGGSSKWLIFGRTSSTANTGNDRAGNLRYPVRGGVRESFYLDYMGQFPSNPLNAYVNLIPIPIWYEDLTTSSPDQFYLLGYAPDVRHVQMENISAGEEFTVGGDTWKVFPLVRKRFLQDNNEESWFCGLAYKKN